MKKILVIILIAFECELFGGIPYSVKVYYAVATTSEPKYELANTIDQDMSTRYDSKWGGGTLPDTLDYYFSDIARIDSLSYFPRTDGSTKGNFGQVEIYYAATNNPTFFAKLKEVDFGFINTPTRIDLNGSTGIIQPAVVRFIVKTGSQDRASCAEMAFYSIRNQAEEMSCLPNPSNPINASLNYDIFTDNICSSLKQDVNQSDINTMPAGFYRELAQCMFNGSYPSESRIQTYEAYPLLTTIQKTLKTSTYSAYENATGIFFNSGEKVVLLVDDIQGQSISLKIADYDTNTTKTYPLQTGENIITLNISGLGYISFYTDNYANLKPVKIHITGGKLNGFFDKNLHNDAHWKRCLTNDAYHMLDMRGRYVTMIFEKAQLKKYCPFDGKLLVDVYDSIISMQYRQMGLYKYNRIPKNRMLAEADSKTWSWYAGGKGAHFSGSCDVTCSPEKARTNCWGIAHELGHINQIRPGLRWIGTIEMTNNVFSILANHTFTPNETRLETDESNDAYYNGFETGTGIGKGNRMIGGRFNAYLNNGVLKKQHWLCQYGGDNLSSSTWQNGGDHFVKLCAWWQLILYYQLANDNTKEWYADVAEIIRNTNESGLSNGTLMLNFMKNTCDALKQDLTSFFLTVGMLRVYDKIIDDYGPGELKITAADSLNLVNYIKSRNYPMPESPVIHYISANSLAAFKQRLSVEGVLNQGCTPVLNIAESYQKYVIVDHAVWKNVIMFETYSASALIRLSVVGSGFASNDKTRVYFPDGSTDIYAVGWDGSRKLVYSNNTSVKNISENLDVKCSPNPVTDILKINNTELKAEKADYHILNSCGQQIRNGTLPANVNVWEINFSEMPAGLYFLQIRLNDKMYLQKIVKNI